MEQLPIAERVAGIDLNRYLEALPIPLSVDGTVLEDETHLFYYWIAKMYPEVGYVDGVSLEDLYLKNVHEVGMTRQDFLQYCDRLGLPVPPHGDAESETPQDRNFRLFLRKHRAAQDDQYIAWAESQSIPTTPGSIMRFLDTEGNEYRVRTDVKNRGQIID